MHLYADDRALASSVVDYVIDGLCGGQGVVLIAHPAHATAFRECLAAGGVDAGEGVQVLDASATLELFMDGGSPDPARFVEVVGGALRAASKGRAGVRVYGEMVESLWRQGNVVGAFALEELWNQLACELPFSLYCAYHDSLAAGATETDLDKTCRLHSAVVADGSLKTRHSALAHFHAGGSAPAAARRFVLGELQAGADSDLTDDVALILSELATNAILYGGDEFSVAVTPLAHAVRISVQDPSPELPVVRDATGTGRTGRGLQIVAALSREWGAERRCDGKTVWVELDLH